MDYLLHIFIITGIYILLSSSLNIISGYLGLLSICHAAFFGIGAYACVLLSMNLGTPFFLNLMLSITLCAVLGLVVGLPSLRLRDDYFLMTTFAFQVIVIGIITNWTSLTGGAMGLPGIPALDIFGYALSSPYQYFLLVAAACAFSLALCRRIALSPYGRVLMAIREDEVFVESLGKNVVQYKLSAFLLSAAIAAVAGALFAHYLTFVEPNSFNIMESILIISMVIIGGSGSLWGPVVGASLLVLFPEVLRFIGLPVTLAANIRQIAYGIMLILMMRYRPQGIIGTYRFDA